MLRKLCSFMNITYSNKNIINLGSFFISTVRINELLPLTVAKVTIVKEILVFIIKVVEDIQSEASSDICIILTHGLTS